MVAMGVLAACSDDPEWDVPSVLLQPEDLSGVDKAHVDEGHSATKTNCAAMEREYNLAITGQDDPYVIYTLDDGTEVRSAVQSPSLQSSSIDHTMTEMNATIETCLADPPTSGTFDRLELAAGETGFRMTEDTSEGTRVTERAYVKVDDDTAAVVTVVHTGEGDPAVTVEDLLPKALDRADG